MLLDRLHRRAADRGFASVKIEAPEGAPLPALLVPQLRSALLRLDRGKAALAGARKALGALRNFASAFKLKFGELEASVEAGEAGVADSGDLDHDLAPLLDAVGVAAAERETAFTLFIDEVQYLRERELGALIGAFHRASQSERPVALIGAGLPQITGLMGDAKSYSERMFRFETIGPLTSADAAAAIERPAAAQGVAWDAAAVEAVIAITRGYPYFLQEWASQAWSTAESSPITAENVKAATPRRHRRAGRELLSRPTGSPQPQRARLFERDREAGRQRRAIGRRGRGNGPIVGVGRAAPRRASQEGHDLQPDLWLDRLHRAPFRRLSAKSLAKQKRTRGDRPAPVTCGSRVGSFGSV